MFQQRAAVDAFIARIAVRKVFADIAECSRTEQRITDRVQQHIRIRVSEQAAFKRNIDATDHAFAAFDQSMHIKAVADTNFRICGISKQCHRLMLLTQ